MNPTGKKPRTSESLKANNMKTIEHTPGPWAVGSNGASIKIVDADGKAVAMITPRREAWNGDLLAAAPELLSALERIAKISGVTAEAAIARAAIAKAKGEIK